MCNVDVVTTTYLIVHVDFKYQNAIAWFRTGFGTNATALPSRDDVLKVQLYSGEKHVELWICKLDTRILNVFHLKCNKMHKI